MNAVERNTERLVTDIKRVVRDSEDVLRATADAMGEKAQDARQRLSNALEAVKQSCDRLEDKTIAGARAADRVIREHPYESIGAALGLGILLGVLFTRR